MHTYNSWKYCKTIVLWCSDIRVNRAPRTPLLSPVMSITRGNMVLLSSGLNYTVTRTFTDTCH